MWQRQNEHVWQKVQWTWRQWGTVTFCTLAKVATHHIQSGERGIVSVWYPLRTNKGGNVVFDHNTSGRESMIMMWVRICALTYIYISENVWLAAPSESPQPQYCSSNHEEHKSLLVVFPTWQSLRILGNFFMCDCDRPFFFVGYIFSHKMARSANLRNGIIGQFIPEGGLWTVGTVERLRVCRASFVEV